MTTTCTEQGIDLREMTKEEAELVMTAVLLLAETTANNEHARILRRAGMQLDKHLSKQ